MPDESVNFSLPTVSLKNHPHCVSGTSWAMGNSWRQQEHFPFFNMNVPRLSFVYYLQYNFSFYLIENLFSLIVMIIFAGVWSAYDHDDKIFIILKYLLVADGRFQKVTVFVYPVSKINRIR